MAANVLALSSVEGNGWRFRKLIVRNPLKGMKITEHLALRLAQVSEMADLVLTV
jgi:hypothetical protein